MDVVTVRLAISNLLLAVCCNRGTHYRRLWWKRGAMSLVQCQTVFRRYILQPAKDIWRLAPPVLKGCIEWTESDLVAVGGQNSHQQWGGLGCTVGGLD